MLDAAPGDDEVERARRYLRGQHAIDRQRNAAHAASLAFDTLYGVGLEEGERYPQRIAAVTREDVLRVARRILTLDRYTKSLVGPDGT